MNDYEKDAAKVKDLIYLLGICPKNYVVRSIGDDPRSLGAINLIIIDHYEEAVVLYRYSKADCKNIPMTHAIGNTTFSYHHITGILYEERRTN